MGMSHVSLFSGIGGIDLAAEWAGFATVMFCEKSPYCQAVLRRHWPGVPIIDDVKDVHHDSVAGPIVLLSGGFPCQPVSHAGKREGTNDDRWLWPDMLRVVSELRPRWVLAENTPGLGTMGKLGASTPLGVEAEPGLADLTSADLALVEQCRDDLAALGYEVAPALLYPARAVWAWHGRERVFIVAHSQELPRRPRFRSFGEAAKRRRRPGDDARVSGESVANSSGGRRSEQLIPVRPGGPLEAEADSERLRAGDAHAEGVGLQERPLGAWCTQGDAAEGIPQRGCDGRRGEPDGHLQWADEPRLGRLAHGVPNRVERIRALGNACVPQQVFPILKGIASIEGGMSASAAGLP